MSIYEDGGKHADRVKVATIYNDDGSTEGRDPREMAVADLTFLGHQTQPILDVIRAKCLDCSCYQRAEVAKCTAYGCPLWPYRMGTNPFRAPMSEERRAAHGCQDGQCPPKRQERSGVFGASQPPGTRAASRP